MKRPTTSDANDWQMWLQDGLQGEPATGCAFLAVQIVEAIEEHQKALAREVYGLAESTTRFSDVASENALEGNYYRGRIDESKSIAQAISAIMPYSRDPAALAHGGRERLAASRGKLDAVPAPFHRIFSHAFTNEAGNRVKATVQDATLDGQPAILVRLEGPDSVTENCVTLREAMMMTALLGFMLDMGRLQ